MSVDLAGKPIVITGASSGIGAATAEACAAAGMPVLLVARREDRLRGVAGAIRAAGGRAEIFAADVGEEASARASLDAAEAAFGPVYAVFANAGYGEEARLTHEMPDAAVRRMFEVNFFASLALVREAAARMLARPAPGPGLWRGHAIMCSSCLSKIGMPCYAAYSATKAAQDHFCRAMRVELFDRRVAVSSVHPIGTRTEFFDRVAERGGSVLTRTPGRLMQPASRVARAVVTCLRRPRGEVWTSLPVRLALALSGAAPGLTDRMLVGAYRRRVGRG